jgi:hypothetical protein
VTGAGAAGEINVALRDEALGIMLGKAAAGREKGLARKDWRLLR